MIAAVGALAPRRARADGAFPDSQIILTPTERPSELVLVTNFGLVSSQDAGATWTWACEQDANAFGIYYQLGATARHRLFAIANKQVVFSDDQSCGWATSGGLLTGQDVSDVWVDRTVVDRVLAVGVSCCTGGQMVHALFSSSDGGTTFDTRLFQADPGANITGVESARSDPKTIYLTLLGAAPDGGKAPPMLARTTDGGATWATMDLTASLGPGGVRLIAVDPDDAGKVFLLWSGVDGQALGVTVDGGMTVTKPFVPDGVMKAFLRMADGTILVSTDNANAAGLYRSRDAGKTFAVVDNPPHVRALAQRGGTVFAATDNFSEGYAIGASTDAGTTWKAVMSYGQVGAILPCLKAACQTSCAVQAQLQLWPDAVCSADAPSMTGTGGGGGGGMPDGGAGDAAIPDGGTGDAAAPDGSVGGGGGATGGKSGGTAGTGGKTGSGGGCSVMSDDVGRRGWLAAACLAASAAASLMALGARRRRRLPRV